MKRNRPVLQLKRTTVEWVSDVIGVLGLAGMWIYAMTHVPMLPDSIPVHFNAAGDPDRWASRGSILSLPAIGTALYVFMLVAGRWPHKFNYLVDITEENAPRLYRLARMMVAALRAEVVWLFVIILWQSIAVGMGDATSLSMAWIFVGSAIITVTGVAFVAKMTF